MRYLRSNMKASIPVDLSISEFLRPDARKAPLSKIILEDTLTGRSISYGGLREQTVSSAEWMRDAVGLQAGQRVAIVGPSSVDYVVAVQAIWYLGATACPISSMLHPDEMQFALETTDPAVVIVHHDLLEKVRSALQKQKSVVRNPSIVTFGNGYSNPSYLQVCIPKRATGFAIINSKADQHQMLTDGVYCASRSSTPLKEYSLAGQDSRRVCALLVLSSGTSGKSKAVMLSHYNLVAICIQMHAQNPDNWRSSQREVFFPPLSHAYGIYVCVLMAPWTGAFVCMMAKFELDHYCRLMQDRRATLARLVPAIAKQLAVSPTTRRYSYPALEYLTCSSAPLHPTVAESLRDIFNGVPLCQTYGATELTGAIAQSGVRDHGKAPLVSGGKLVANVGIRFIDHETGGDAGLRGPGEILVRSPSAMMGYKDNEDATKSSFVDGDWLRTGDVGFLDENDYLILIDRLKDVIKVNGLQVSPTELEEKLLGHEFVEEVAVRGVTSRDRTTEYPRAFVVLNPKFRHPKPDAKNLARIAAELKEFVRPKVSKHKQIRGGVVFLDELPRNTNNKVLRRLLPLDVPAYREDGLPSKL
ncbi:AMP-binding enzyme domain-containing protein [Cladophialophora immunda]|nr:AMP-binding enzyme domain-containing protein [Cladophialophora immunda]